MNVAYLLVSTAWLAGAEPAQDYRPTPAYTHTVGGCGAAPCHTSCDSCDSGRRGFMDRIRGLFRRNRGHGDDCCTPCPAPCPPPCPAPQVRCDNPCDSCDSGRRGFMDRIRGLFRRNHNHCDDCCAPACNGHVVNGHGVPHGYGVPHHMPKAETIPGPKKMPAGDGQGKPGNGNGQPKPNPDGQQSLVPPAPINVPALQGAPAIPQPVPAQLNGNRDF